MIRLATAVTAVTRVFFQSAVAAEENLPGLVLVRPGTQVDQKAPADWSNLVLKALPKVVSGDLDSLPEFAATTATLFRSILLADVRPDPNAPGRYHLKRIGLGLCMPTDGHDAVVTGGNPDSPPEALGFVEKQVLSRAEDELKKARLVARTPTFAVLAAPTDLKVGEAHQKVYLVYTFLVEPRSGRLETYLWLLAGRPDRRSAPTSLLHLTPGLIYQCGLDVAADRLLGTIPMNWSFAMQSLPPGQRLATSAKLKDWLIDPSKIAAGPAEFERLLRTEIETAAHHASPAR